MSITIPTNVMSNTQTENRKFKPFIVGDLHISDKYSGRHVDYLQDCIDFLDQITEEIKKNEVTHLILTGDLIGRTTEKNLQSRDTLMYFMKVLQHWNELTNGHVYSNRGNHDFSEKLTDFEMFVTLGLIKTPKTLDVGLVRFHLMDYGAHERAIDFDDDKYNVAVMHTELHVEGVTGWFFRSSEGVELSNLENLYGVEMVIAGHIHNPSVRPVQTSIRDKSITLFYPGNGTRPKYDSQVWTECFGVLFETDNNNVSTGQVTFKLKDPKEIYHKVFDDIVEEEDDEDSVVNGKPMFNIEELSEIMKQLTEYNIMGEADYRTQIANLGGLDREAVDLAFEYIGVVEGEMK